MTTWRARGYRRLASTLSQKATAGKRGNGPIPFLSRNGRRRAWFHAASVGELECLVPILRRWLAGDFDLIITIFSESAESALSRLILQLSEEERTRVLYSGYSPLEGAWKAALENAAPEVFVTAKYEAWPDLWMSLAEAKIPLVIVGARDRKSIRTCKRLIRFFGGPMPRISFLLVESSDQGQLADEFPEAGIEVVGETRWDQVMARATRGSERARELVSWFSRSARPWGVLGSVWAEDLAIWKESGATGSAKGTWWVVPHKVDSEHLAGIESSLRALGINHWKRTSQLRTSADVVPSDGLINVVLVDEMGFLLELYSTADWAYVGGGFGAGIHSTIEPALFGIPVAGGPKSAEKFPEISQLRNCGQMSLVKDGVELREWFETAMTQSQESREHWKRQALQRLGAADRALNAIRRVAGLSAR